MPDPTPDPDRDFEAARRITRRLQPFWDILGRLQPQHGAATDATFLAALLETSDSILLRILHDDRRDLDAFRLALQDVVDATRIPSLGGGMTEPARCLIEVMSEEMHARHDVQREEYVLLGLLRVGTPRVRGLLAAFGIDRDRVLRELPAEVRAAAAVDTISEPASTPPSGAPLLPALAHSSAIRLLDFVYERRRQGYPPSPINVLVELAQLPYSPVPRIATEQGHRSDEVQTILREANRTAPVDPQGREPDWTAAADRIMSIAFGLWRGRGELTLDHFLLALLEAGGERVTSVLTALDITPERVRAALPRLGADM